MEAQDNKNYTLLKMQLIKSLIKNNESMTLDEFKHYSKITSAGMMELYKLVKEEKITVSKNFYPVRTLIKAFGLQIDTIITDQ